MAPGVGHPKDRAYDEIIGRAFRGARLLRDAGPLILGKNVRAEVIGCMVAAIQESQTVLNGNDVR